MSNFIISIILPQVLDSMYIKLYTFIILPPIQDSIYAKLYTFYNPASCSGQYVLLKSFLVFPLEHYIMMITSMLKISFWEKLDLSGEEIGVSSHNFPL